MSVALALAALLLTAGAAVAQDGSFILFHATSDDPASTDFLRVNGEWTVQAGIVYTQFVHVYASLSGASASGIVGAEFYVDGVEAAVDAGFQASVTPNPALYVVSGSPILPSGPHDDRRYHVAFPTCDPGQFHPCGGDCGRVGTLGCGEEVVSRLEETRESRLGNFCGHHSSVPGNQSLPAP